VKSQVTVGIDLGTSNSCVAALIDGKPRVLNNANGEATTASVVAFAEDGKITVGNEAKRRIILDPMHTVASAKRLIGRYIFSEEVQKAKALCRYEIVDDGQRGVRIKVREELFSLPEISAFILTELKHVAERELSWPVRQAVITVPAYFNDNQRQATKDAGRIAGLDVLRLLNEPTAAALAYGYGKDLRQRVAVYDLGGGTFDISVLEIDGDVFEVLATCGDTYLGGDDFDDRIIDMLADLVQEQHGCNVRSDPYALERLKAAAEKAKIGLSARDSSAISIPKLTEHDGQDIALEYNLTRQGFERLTMDLIQRTFKVCDEAMQSANLTVRDLDGVILVGGPTQLPTIRDAVRQYFGKEPEAGINPDQVVAIGAAIHAASIGKQESDSFLLDVTPLSLRLGIAGGLTEPVIERNSPVPIDHTRIFTPARDNQASVTVNIYQGEERAADANEQLGSFEFSGYVPGPRKETQIEVRFTINAEGIVKVSARDPKTGAEHATTVSMSSSLSEGELQEIMARNRSADVQEQDAREPPCEEVQSFDEDVFSLPDEPVAPARSAAPKPAAPRSAPASPSAPPKVAPPPKRDEPEVEMLHDHVREQEQAEDEPFLLDSTGEPLASTGEAPSGNTDRSAFGSGRDELRLEREDEPTQPDLDLLRTPSDDLVLGEDED
jgi:molecular chaperone DnaK